MYDYAAGDQGYEWPILGDHVIRQELKYGTF